MAHHAEVDEFDAAETMSLSSRHMLARKVSPFRLLEQSDVDRLRRREVDELVELLQWSVEEVARVLRHHHWNRDRVLEDEQVLERLCRLNSGAARVKSLREGEELCLICFESLPVSQMLAAAACTHYYCKECWRGYVTTAVAEGPVVLDLRCPTPKCGLHVLPKVVEAVADPATFKKYHAYELKSFIEDNKKMCWCVGPGCETAVEILMDLDPDRYLGVKCDKCETEFCFNCKDQPHGPVPCAYMRQWALKNSSEAESLQYVLVNTKNCPSCKWPIEKNAGCMHMTCSRCKHQFCWLCLGNWSEHGSATGGNFRCNIYTQRERDGEYADSERELQRIKAALDRYNFHFTRWAEHHRSLKKAQSDRISAMEKFQDHVSSVLHVSKNDLVFLPQAWEQVVHCRRILALSYVYGYYCFEPEQTKDIAEGTDPNQLRAFFQFLQGEAERSLERLHGAAEKCLKETTVACRYTSKDLTQPHDQLKVASHELQRLTQATGTYFVRLVDQIEAGFDQLQTQYAGRTKSSAEQFERERAEKRQKEREEELQAVKDL